MWNYTVYPPWNFGMWFGRGTVYFVRTFFMLGFSLELWVFRWKSKGFFVRSFAEVPTKNPFRLFSSNEIHCTHSAVPEEGCFYFLIKIEKGFFHFHGPGPNYHALSDSKIEFLRLFRLCRVNIILGTSKYISFQGQTIASYQEEITALRSFLSSKDDEISKLKQENLENSLSMAPPAYHSSPNEQKGIKSRKIKRKSTNLPLTHLNPSITMPIGALKISG